MGIISFLVGKKQAPHRTLTEVNTHAAESPGKSIVRDSPDSYIDASSISPDERPFYQPDSYYTYYSYPGTHMSQRVITFEERKATTFPTARGLFVAEVLLLEYCSYGNYPKPKNGYPGFWWFKYGIRDVGHALLSLEQRGFLQWASAKDTIKHLKIDELKQVLTDAGLSASGRKADLIERITAYVPEDKITAFSHTPKYMLTEKGKLELQENGYVPYMHKHHYTTTENSSFGETFNVWDINKLFPDGNASNWRDVVGRIEQRRFGVNMANSQNGG